MKKLLFLVAFMAMTALSANAQCTKSAGKACCSKEKMGTAACPTPTGAGTASAAAVTAEPMVKKVAASTAEKPACCAKDAKAAGKCSGDKATKTAAVLPVAAPMAAPMEVAAEPVSNNNN